jgi:hypothetical protein
VHAGGGQGDVPQRGRPERAGIRQFPRNEEPAAVTRTGPSSNSYPKVVEQVIREQGGRSRAWLIL